MLVFEYLQSGSEEAACQRPSSGLRYPAYHGGHLRVADNAAAPSPDVFSSPTMGHRVGTFYERTLGRSEGGPLRALDFVTFLQFCSVSRFSYFDHYQILNRARQN